MCKKLKKTKKSGLNVSKKVHSTKKNSTKMNHMDKLPSSYQSKMSINTTPTTNDLDHFATGTLALVDRLYSTDICPTPETSEILGELVKHAHAMALMVKRMDS